MKKLLVTLAASAALASPTALAAPAAASDGTTNYAKVVYPAWDHNGGVVNIQLQGARRAWHLAGFAKKMDRRIGGIKVRAFEGNCRHNRNAYCVTVRSVFQPNNNAWGQTHYVTHGAVIDLNRFYSAPGSNWWAAAHEFLHALGMMHHRYGAGMLKLPTPSMKPVSSGELAALRRAY